MTETETKQVANGTPCWYELATTDLDGASAFYGAVMDWTLADAGMPDMTYQLATAADGAQTAGLGPVDENSGMPPAWTIYFSTTDCDRAVSDFVAAGAAPVVEPTDIPETGRFAILADPQGAMFALLQPEPTENPPTGTPGEMLPGHGSWLELMTTDPGAAFDFYASQFAWTKGEALEMGPIGIYQLFQLGGADIGGMMGLGNSPVPMWLPYFGSNSVSASADRITEAGGSVQMGPAEVPGGGHYLVATDPQGAWFGMLGAP